MPIKGVSEIRRMPRLGKIRLGIKVEEPKKNPYPRPTDYFVVPEPLKANLGEKPTKLPIMFPTEDPGEFARQFLKCYSFTQGLICRGDGEVAVRKTDIETGDVASHTTKEWIFKDVPCDPDTCPQFMGDPERGIRPQCRRVMNLLFLLPDVPGFGVWQLDTSSFYSIVNINSCLDLIKRLCGRISFIPLQLSLEPMEVTPPGVKRKTVHILYVRSEVKLAEIQKLGKIPSERVLLPAIEEEGAPEDLFPPEALSDFPQETPGVTAPAAGDTQRETGEAGGPLKKLPSDPASVKTFGDLYAACAADWPNEFKRRQDVWKELGVSSQEEISDTPAECFQKICAVRVNVKEAGK